MRVKLIRSGVILASGCRYCHGKWNDSSGISVATQSIRHQSESSVSGLATASNFYARQIARCMAIWRKILSTDKKDRIKFAVHRHLCDITDK
ncbi:hypothetical protein HMPREF3040_02091 [Escherichia coli]|nr:hypothetical protein HMPREF3040_02091 [Escherichia coli]